MPENVVHHTHLCFEAGTSVDVCRNQLNTPQYQILNANNRIATVRRQECYDLFVRVTFYMLIL